ncbi:MAG: hypothetical protein MAG431_00700 [Chloroflexi bacterium]|nr:hypothetical protein [Chloroflexota bacterium]
MNHIGKLNEQPLHKALKAWYAQPGDGIEASVDGYVIDIVQGDGLVEIQTGNFSALKGKLLTLVKDHPVRLVYPIAREKWLFKLPRKGWDAPRRRKSPKQGRVVEVFGELVSFPQLLQEKNFTLEVALIQEEEVRRYVGKKAWYKNGWKTVERRLLDVLERRVFGTPGDVATLLPPGLPETFTTADLSQALDIPRWLAQKMAYCLREMGVLAHVGKRGNAFLYERA